MVLNTRRNASTRLATSRLGVITLAAALTAALALYFAPRLVLAREQPAGNAPDASALAELPGEAPALATLVPDTEPTGAERADPFSPTPVKSGGEIQQDASEPGLPAPPAVPPPAASIPPRPAIIARQDFKPAPPRPSANELPDVGPAPRSDQPGALPRQPRRPEARARDTSIEERLARLEEMVHSLLAQKGGRFAPGEAPPEWRDSENRARMREKELFERQDARAADEAARVRQEREKEFRSEPGQRRQDKLRADLARRMKSLQEQRENLERQMQELRRDIEKIEREQQGVKQRNEEDNLPKKRKTEPGE